MEQSIRKLMRWLNLLTFASIGGSLMVSAGVVWLLVTYLGFVPEQHSGWLSCFIIMAPILVNLALCSFATTKAELILNLVGKGWHKGDALISLAVFIIPVFPLFLLYELNPVYAQIGLTVCYGILGVIYFVHIVMSIILLILVRRYEVEMQKCADRLRRLSRTRKEHSCFGE